ncbi:DUF3380 domain-containing protein [Lichenibacterium minor]|uniref:DUF3380 domain-containing protein n=1 Tax=Lichenibacterium minor TaxID=2316528 RepID=A0A4Q2U2F4_9HYPH|nr:N-acetylmuramidase domain-containing protein [Lichenibacterium minor]RYC29017.1 DUF3380 domain-containing protein [Lichenibacterium minor]
MSTRPNSTTLTDVIELPAPLKASALSTGLALTKWARHGYDDQTDGPDRLSLLRRMARVDENAAYRSVSMGLGQIMGFNAAHAGYATAHAMYDAFRDLDAQCRAIVAVLPALGVLQPLKDHDWVTTATRYNGPGERHNEYDAKLASAYAHWRFALNTGQTAPPEHGLGLWSRGPEVRTLQTSLCAAGLPTVVDGIYGPKTAMNVAAFQLAHGMPSTQGIADQATLDAIVNADADPIPQGAREVATAESLKPRSETIQAASKLNVGGLVTAGIGTVTTVGGTVQAVSSSVSSTHDQVNAALDKADAVKATLAHAQGLAPAGTFEHVGGWLASHPMPFVGLAMAALGGLCAYLARDIIERRVLAHQTGATT